MKTGEEQWTAIDEYISEKLIPTDPVMAACLEASAAAGLPAIQVSPCQARLLQILVQIHGARSILEIGTLGGYSTISLARALPTGGRLITLEVNRQYAQVASANIARANLLQVVELRLGPALETLPRLAAEKRGPFDFVFIDADKSSTPDYFSWALKLSRRGSLIVVDNVIRKGALLDGKSRDPAVLGMRRFMKMLGAQPRVNSTAIQTVGCKGYDGFAIALITSDA